MENKFAIAIVGCGRMGSLLAKRISVYHQVYIYDKNIQKSQELSKQCQAQVIDLEDFKKADILILALDSEHVCGAIEELEKYLGEQAIWVNIATSLQHKSVEAKHKVVSAKIVGHAKEIANGEEPVVVVEGDDSEATKKVVQVFQGIGKVITGKSDVVGVINTIASRQGVIAGFNVKQELEELNLPNEVVVAAIRLVAAGVMKAFAVGDAGPFVQKIIAEQKESGRGKED